MKQPLDMMKLENKKSTKPSKATKSTKEVPTKISKNWLELEKVKFNHENEGFSQLILKHVEISLTEHLHLIIGIELVINE